MKLVTRTFCDTKINSGTIKMENGNPIITPLDCVTIPERLDDEERAVKIVKKKLGVTQPIVITELTHVEYTRAMPVEMFLEHSQPIENFKNH